MQRKSSLEITCNFPNAILQVSIVGCYDVALVLCHTIHDAVIGVGALVHAGDSLESWIFHNFQCHFVLLAHFLQFGHHAVGDVWDALGIQTIHHILNHIQLILDTVMHEIGIDQNVIWRSELCVVLKEESG